MTLTDDGKGFDPTVDFTGNGLRNMHNRVKKIGGELEINSEIGVGTQLRFIGKLC